MDEKTAFDKMKCMVLQKLKHTLDSPTDFDYLALQITKATGESISSTTLKRIFGYISSESEPRRSSLSIISRYLGYSGWSTFVNQANNVSGYLSEEGIMASQLHLGDKVQLQWAPDRVVCLEFMGKERFRVLKSLNSQLQMGDMVEISLFILNQPLQVKSVFRDGENYGRYSAGMNGGLTKVQLIH